ncbi:MAG: helix-turn-helix domain-containing protein [Proteobacteria bacterium]|nr:helix-turn-helix domain-containing protein [Pseudomonadota bacterium]MBU4035112.1 helix-turn-helix domain-containing protein [Pseudomonadota bacterium]
MPTLQGTKISYSKPKIYKSLGSLIKDYRQWRELSQETIARLVGVSARQLRNWEADRRRARIENLHDLAEVTGIPMQVFVALNADQPLWYSMQERRFAYSSVEAHSLHRELFRYPEKSGDEILLKSEPISKNKHMSMVLSCHQDIYCTLKPLRSDVVQKASMILPDLNRIIFDSWGHYAGHSIWLPLKIDDYNQLKQEASFESYLTPDKISDVIALGEGIFLDYSSYLSSLDVAQFKIMNSVRYFANLKQNANYLLAVYTAMEELNELLSNMGMEAIRSYENMNSEVCNKLYEVGLDVMLKPDGPWKWLVEKIRKKQEMASSEQRDKKGNNI